MMALSAATAATAQTEQRNQQEERQLTVDELFQLVETGSKTLQVRKTNVDFADKGIEAAQAGRLPDIGAQLQLSYNGNVLVSDRDFSDMHGYSAPHLGTGFSLEARQVVYAGGAVSAAVEMARLGKEQATTAVELTRQQQRFMALGLYLDLMKLDHRSSVYEDNIRLTERLVDDIKARQEQGMALQNDVTRYELQLESLRLQLRKVADQRDILNHELQNTLDISGRIVPTERIDIVSATTDRGQQEWIEQTVGASPMMEQSRLATRMTRQELRMAKSELKPKVSLFAADLLNGPYIYDLPPKDINVNNWMAGVGISYSLSSLFKQNKRVKQAQLACRRSEEELAVTMETLNNQMQAAYTLYQQSMVELQTQMKSVELARQNYNVVNERYAAQLALVTDMLDASNMKLQAELAEADARIGIVYAYNKLKYIAGDL